MEPITSENALSVDIPKLALDSRFGSLVFENGNKKLTKTQEWLNEISDLGYREHLLPDDIAYIERTINDFASHLSWLQNFDIGAVENAKAEHDAFENRIDGFYNDIYRNLLMKFLPFLREERRRENPDQQFLDEEVKRAVKLRSELEDELKGVREETQKIRSTNKDVAIAKGERATTQTARHFDEEVGRYDGLAKNWLKAVIGGYFVIILVLFWSAYETLNYIKEIVSSNSAVQTSTSTPMIISSGVIWSVIVAKLVFLAALWYGLSFIVKNYNVNSHLAAVNRHRAAVARTLEDFLAVEQQQEKPRLSEILQNATNAMFKNVSIGFISRTEKDNGNPILQIVNDVMGVKGGE